MASPAAPPLLAPRLVTLGLICVACSGAPLLLLAAYHGARGLAVDSFGSQAAALRRLALEQRNGFALFAAADAVLGLCFFAPWVRYRAWRLAVALAWVAAIALTGFGGCRHERMTRHAALASPSQRHARLAPARDSRARVYRRCAAYAACSARPALRSPPALATSAASVCTSCEHWRTAAATGRDSGWARGRRFRRRLSRRRRATRRNEPGQGTLRHVVTREASPSACCRALHATRVTDTPSRACSCVPVPHAHAPLAS